MPARDDSRFKVAAVQATPVYLDLDATVARACERIAAAAHEGARLIVFPEAFVPGYPDWVWSVPIAERRVHARLYAELVANSVSVPSAATERLASATREAGAYVVIGVNERNAEASGTSLYNSLLFFSPEGTLIAKHRKLIPTGAERLVWAQGDGSTLRVHDLPFGKLSALICWENYMPLARYAMYAWGAQIHVAATWDRGEPWISTMRHVAKEGRVFVIGTCQAFRRADVPERLELGRFYAADREWINVGDSVIVDPDGKIIAGPLHEQEGILYAEIESHELVGPRWILDVAGHYARPDVFEFNVRRVERSVIGSGGDGPGEASASSDEHARVNRRSKSGKRPRAGARKKSRLRRGTARRSR
jgi:nitrilase